MDRGGNAGEPSRDQSDLYDGAQPVKNRLRVLRAEREWSQQQLADALEVSRQSVNAIETGKYDPSLPLAFRIADVFGLAIEQIFLRD